MTPQKRLVLCVEGESDVTAAVTLTRAMLTRISGWDALSLDENPLRVGHAAGLAAGQSNNWKRYVQVAAMRAHTGAVLLLLDGDAKHDPFGTMPRMPFCARDAARTFAKQARGCVAHRNASVAVVFARCEFESWLIACVAHIRGLPLPDGRSGIAATAPPVPDADESPRDAKNWLSQHMSPAYRATMHLEPLTKLLADRIGSINPLPSRSLRRFESALTQLVVAAREARTVYTPA